MQLMEIARDPTTSADDVLRSASDALDYLDPDVVAKLARQQYPEVVGVLLSAIRDPSTAEDVKDECAKQIVDAVSKMLATINELESRGNSGP
ncbi:hypothetical protein D3C76_1753250 [compost metagenome]